MIFCDYPRCEKEGPKLEDMHHLKKRKKRVLHFHLSGLAKLKTKSLRIIIK